MAKALATFFALGFLSLAFIGIGLGLSHRLTPEQRRLRWKTWIIGWSIKGLIVPAVIWFLMNIGLSWQLQPFTPEVQAAKNSGDPWFPAFGAALSTGLFILSTYWAALTIIWALFLAFKGLEGEERSDFRALCLTGLLGMILPAVGIFYLGGWPIAGIATSAILLPIAGYAPAIIKP